jgi:hypothetical protein
VAIHLYHFEFSRVKPGGKYDANKSGIQMESFETMT